MAKLTANVLLSRDGNPVVLLAGEELPEWATDLVGEHALDGVAVEPESEAKPEPESEAKPEPEPEAKPEAKPRVTRK